MGTLKPESHSVDFIPLDERKGHPASQFPLWFSVNMMLLTTLTGGIGILVGLNIIWTIVAIVCGNFVGALFVAGHAIQGPHLGIPQMIQSRAQFGYYGAAVPLVAVLLMYLGYFASNQVIAGDAIEAGTPLSKSAGIIISGIIILAITFYGHDLIHKVERIFAVLLGLGFLTITILVLQQGFPEGAWSLSGFAIAPFLIQVAATAAWQLTFAPYIADYSRYLPINTDGKKLVFFTYSGLVVSTTWLMSLGAMLAAIFPTYGDGPSEIIASLFPSSFAPMVFTFIVLGVIATNVFNLYGAFMSLTTIVDTFKKVPNSVTVRGALIAIVFVAGILLAVVSSGNFMLFFENLLVVLGYMLFPWTSINLVDYFFVRKGKYNIDAIFDPNGKYGAYNIKAIAAYMITILLEIPFMDTAFFTGFLFDAVGGIDYAWIIALLLPGLLYYLFMGNQRKVEREEYVLPDENTGDAIR